MPTDGDTLPPAYARLPPLVPMAATPAVDFCSTRAMPSAPPPAVPPLVVSAWMTTVHTNASTATAPGHHAAPAWLPVDGFSSMGSWPAAPPYTALPTTAHAVAVAVGLAVTVLVGVHDGVSDGVAVHDAVFVLVAVRDDDCVMDAGVDVMLGVGTVSL